ncbi:MAG: nuclear transport factor 2 family protein [Dokdonella sp.]|nr:nuclear transport factor 2 family protein [Dokdonella sp.]
MKAVLLVVLLCASALLGGAAAAGPSPSSPEQQLRLLMDEMLAAANAHDTDRFMAVYERSPTLMLTFDDQTLVGWQAVRDQQLQWWNGGETDAVYRLRGEPKITVISPDVVATLQSLEVEATGPDGKKGTVKVMATSIWKKRPEGWRIVLAHESLLN